jgi:anti-sigma B factor antagonist
MKYSHSIDKGVLKITFSGDLIGESNGPDIVEIVNDAISQSVKYGLVDLTDVRYINSSGIGVLITIHTKFKNKSGELFLINPSEHVKKLFIITKLQSIFNIVLSESEALSKISK